MKSDRLLWFLGAGLLITLGVLGVRLLPARDPSLVSGLGDGLWLGRQVDLLVQLGLMLVGALGIRALLPGDDEED